MNLDPLKIKRRLVPGSFIRHVTIEPVVDSTNARLLEAAKEGRAGPGDCLAAEEQTAGSGRRGRKWHSVPYTALTFSFLCRNFFPRQPGWITVGTAAAVAEAVERETGVKPFIKWPNDLYVEGKKLGGILAQTVPPLVVVGVGLNVNAEPDEALEVPPVCLETLTGSPFDRTVLLAAILNELHVVTTLLDRGETDEVLEALHRRSLLVGRRARFEWKRTLYEGRVVEHTRELGIRLETDEGSIVLPGETAALQSLDP